jgi:hypothetical protein
MAYYSRIICMVLLGTLVTGPFIASWQKFGISSERDAEIVKLAAEACARTTQTAQGAVCTRNTRSSYIRRAIFSDGGK